MGRDVPSTVARHGDEALLCTLMAVSKIAGPQAAKSSVARPSEPIGSRALALMVFLDTCLILSREPAENQA
jgi:hypothetical protein